MPPIVTLGASLMCSFGTAPSPLMVTPAKRTMGAGTPVATIADMTPTNILPFMLCTSLMNPVVAAATAAALGALTPMPCIPAPVSPWQPGAPTVTVGGVPALTMGSLCNCAYGGVISILPPGVPTVLAT